MDHIMPDIDHARSHPALTDAQTGLANRLHFDLVYNYLFLAGNRGFSFTVLLVSAGSEERASTPEIRSLGQAIESTTRDSDLVSYMGRGRFVVLLLGTNLPGGQITADRIETTLMDLAPGNICFGLAVYSDEAQSSQALLHSADTALLAAEASGGGVEFA